jgi:colicin import membrane protein
MHVLLFLFLWIGIHWQSKTPVGVDAEIWDMHTREAAPVPVAVVPPPPPPPPPEVEKVEPPKPSAQEIEEEHEVEIALQRAKEKKLAEKKQLEEQQEQQKRQAELEKEQKKQELAKIADQKKAEALAQKQREDNLKRMTSQVAGSGGTGDAVKSTGNNRVDSGYAGKIAAKIKSNMVYVGSDSMTDNPTVDFRIDLFPDGSLRGTPHKTRSSGVPAFDDAVERAISKSAPFPADKSGNVPPTIPLTYRLKD